MRIATWVNRHPNRVFAELAQLTICENPRLTANLLVAPRAHTRSARPSSQ